MTYREAAEKSGISHAYIRYLEIGKRPGTNTPINPSPDMLKGLSKAYNHSYKDLMIKAGYDYEEINTHEDVLDEHALLKKAYDNVIDSATKEDLELLELFVDKFKRNK